MATLMLQDLLLGDREIALLQHSELSVARAHERGRDANGGEQKDEEAGHRTQSPKILIRIRATCVNYFSFFVCIPCTCSYVYSKDSMGLGWTFGSYVNRATGGVSVCLYLRLILTNTPALCPPVVPTRFWRDQRGPPTH